MRMPEEPAVAADPWDQATPNAGAQFGQQWDEQQYGTAQPAYQYSNSADYAQASAQGLAIAHTLQGPLI